MATAHPIAPFPADIDRTRFGDWLAGFTDGEGCFLLNYAKRNEPHKAHYAAATFIITLRADDQNILECIAAFLECGHLRHRTTCGPSKPQFSFRVSAIADLMTKVIPVFKRHPLLAKKSRDFAIWSTGVELAYQVSRRRWEYKNKGMRGGLCPKWTPEETRHFIALVDTLKAQRQFKAADVEIPKGPQKSPQRTLFDIQ